VIFDLGGAALALEAAVSLSDDERRFLEVLPRRRPDYAGGVDFLLAVSPDPPSGHALLDEVPDGYPAVVRFGESSIQVRHHRYCAELDAAARRGRLYRRPDASGALGITLRLAMTAVLPLAGGLPIHGAGVVVRGSALVFFGPSEAGKTTISRASPWPVVSDEMVAVAGNPPSLHATGYLRWHGPEPELPAPLAGLVMLSKGPGTEIDRLSRADGLRRLLHNLWVPPVPLLQREALRVAARVVETVPVYRLAWNPERPPFEEIEKRLLGA
jgi:hypothetical protein